MGLFHWIASLLSPTTPERLPVRFARPLSAPEPRKKARRVATPGDQTRTLYGDPTTDMIMNQVMMNSILTAPDSPPTHQHHQSAPDHSQHSVAPDTHTTHSVDHSSHSSFDSGSFGGFDCGHHH